MHREAGYIQLPPDSTGKAAGAAGRLIIDYTSESAPNIFYPGMTVTGSISGASGEIVGINRRGFSSGTGQLIITLDGLSGTFVVSENLQISAVTYAVVNGTAPLDKIYYQKFVQVDRDNPNNYQKVSSEGAATVRFSEGEPVISAFGGIVVDQEEGVQQYKFAYNETTQDFLDQTSGGGTISYVSNESAVLLDTNGTASGAYAKRTSHFYHPYQPGRGIICKMSIVVGDSGKTNVRRRWGLFDDNDGLFFELDGTTLYVVQRSSTTGSPVDTRIAQSSFNEDKLDGSGSEGLVLDLTKTQLFWIDYQWLGVGRVRFGIFDESGNRKVAHVVGNTNSISVPYMHTGTLPVRLECENTGTAASSSELKWICGAVESSGKTRRQTRSYSVCMSSRLSVANTDGEVPAISIRPTSTINSKTNRGLYIIDSISVSNTGLLPAVIRIRKDSTLTAASFADHSTGVSGAQIDESATGFSAAGSAVHTVMIGANSHENIDLQQDRENFQSDIRTYNKADGTQVPLSCSIQTIDTGSSNILISINWKEVLL